MVLEEQWRQGCPIPFNRRRFHRFRKDVRGRRTRRYADRGRKVGRLRFLMSRPRSSSFHLAIAAVVMGGMAISLSAAEPFYLGKWKIESAKMAPWWDAKTRKPTEAEMKSLVGKMITITPRGIQGPRALACKEVRYEVKEYAADMLFQGAFGELHERDKSIDPGK